MCGRYASARKRIELLEEFSVERDRTTQPLAPDYNVAPTKSVYAVLTRDGKDARDARDARDGRDGGDDERPAPSRQLRVVRWGLVPSWAKDVSIGSRLINARSETVATSGMFKAAFVERRCLVPATVYYEWRDEPDGSKTPFAVARVDDNPVAFAGIWEKWGRQTARRCRPSPP